MEALHAGSITGTGDIFFILFFYMMMMVERRAAAQANAKRERRHAGMSAANVALVALYILAKNKSTYDLLILVYGITRDKVQCLAHHY